MRRVTIPEVTSLLSSLAGEVIRAQRRLDADHLRRLDDWKAETVAPAGISLPVLSTAPVRMVTQRTEIVTECQFRTERERGWGIRVLSLGYRTKYAHSTDRQGSIHVTIAQAPLLLGRQPIASTQDRGRRPHDD